MRRRNCFTLVLIVFLFILLPKNVLAESNEEIIYNFLKNNLNLNTAVACGVLANIEKESGFNPTLSILDTNGEYTLGICQWNGSRKTALEQYCGSQCKTVTGQLDYLKHELETSEKAAWNNMNLSSIPNTIDGAALAALRWAQYFERCAHFYCPITGKGYMNRHCSSCRDLYQERENSARTTYWPKYNNTAYSNPLYEDSYWGEKTATTIRPIITIKNPDTVDKVRFAVWTTENQSDIKWVTANYNGYNSYFSDISTAGFVNSKYNCHVYVYGKNGSTRCYILTARYPDPIYKKSYWGETTATTRRPVVEIANPDMVEKVQFAVWTTSDQSDIKWLNATNNGYGSWFYDFKTADFVNTSYNCHVYIYGKNGSTRCFILTVNYPDPIYKQSYWGEHTATTRRPVVEFSNPDMVDKVRFAVWSTSNQSDIKWFDAYFNGYGSWFYDFKTSDFTNSTYNCHIYVYAKNGSVRSFNLTAEMPDPICDSSYWVELNETTLRPVAEFIHSEMVDKVQFAVWTTSNQSDIKWYNGINNGGSSFFYDLPITEFVNKVFNCHVYVYAKNGSVQSVPMKTHDLDNHSYSITYHLDGGENADDNPNQYTAGTALTIEDPSKEHYDFMGWYLSETGEEQFENGKIYDRELNLYARWKKTEYEITLYANHEVDQGNEPTSWVKRVTYGDPFGELPVPEWYGYNFDGWFTLAENGSQIAETSVYTEGVSFFAQWSPKEFSLSFDINMEGLENVPSRKIKYKEQFGELPVCSFEGYDFLGWFDSADGTKKYTSSSIYNFTVDITLCARWEQKVSHVHSYVSAITQNPTCTKTGIRTYTCECGDFYTEEIPATGHQHTEIRENREATCAVDGYTGDTWCTDCETRIAKGNTVAALNHDWLPGNITRQPTCTEAGVQEYTCSRCKDTKTEPVPELGHSEETILRFKKEATCTVDGYSGDKYCSKCYDLVEEGYVIPATGHQHTTLRDAVTATCTEDGYSGDTWCIDCETRTKTGSVLTKLGHDWVAGDIIKQPTCIEAGAQEYTCSRCRDMKTEPIPAGHNLTEHKAIAATCKNTGNSAYWSCSVCNGFFSDADGNNPINENSWIISLTSHTWNDKYTTDKAASCYEEGSESIHCTVCNAMKDGSSRVIAKTDHTWDKGTETTPATTTSEGLMTYTCTVCKTTRTEPIPKLKGESSASPTPTITPTPTPEPKAADGTAVGKGASAKIAASAILTASSDEGPSGSSFALLQAKVKKTTKSSITISWTKTPGASEYIVYGAKCGQKFAEIGKTKKTSFTQKKLKKSTYYKYMVMAVSSQQAVVATSKTLHIVTDGSKKGNYKSVTVNKKSVSLAKKGKTFKIKAKAVAKTGKTVKAHRKLAYESSDPTIAKVSKSGKITAVKKGKCIIYVYAADGTFAKLTVTVKK